MAVKKSLGMEIKQKATPNMSSLSAADKKSKAGRKRPRPGDFDYILEEHEQPDRQPEEPMDKFVTVRKKSVTIQDTRKPVTPLPVTEDSPRKTSRNDLASRLLGYVKL